MELVELSLANDGLTSRLGVGWELVVERDTHFSRPFIVRCANASSVRAVVIVENALYYGINIPYTCDWGTTCRWCP